MSSNIASFFLPSDVDVARNNGATTSGQAAIPPSDSAPLSDLARRAVSSSLRHSCSYHQDPTLKRDYMLLEYHWKSERASQQDLYCYHQPWTHSIASHPWRHHVGVMCARHRSCDPASHSILTKNPSVYVTMPRHWLSKPISCADGTAFPLEPWEVGLSALEPPLAYSLNCCQWLPTGTIRPTLEISFAEFSGTVWLVQMSWRPQENISSGPLSKNFSLLPPPTSQSEYYRHQHHQYSHQNNYKKHINIANMVSDSTDVISATPC